MATTSTTSGSPILTLPTSEAIGADGTIAVTGSYSDSFAQSNSGQLFLGISDGSGLLYAGYPGTGGAETTAPGSGSHAISFQGSYADLQAIINSLTYVATSGSSSDDIHYDVWNQAGVETTGSVPVAIGSAGTTQPSGGGSPPPSNTSGTSGTSSGPALNEPASETVAPGATQSVSGSYSDSFAAGNSGSMYLSITDSSGTLRATNGAGVAVAGSGSHSIVLNTDYADVNAVLRSLTYTAGGTAGSDDIRFDIWNQGGVETTGSVPVSVTGTASGGGGNVIYLSHQGQTITTGSTTIAGSADTVINDGTFIATGSLDLMNTGTGTSDIGTLTNNGVISANAIAITRPLTQSEPYAGGMPNWQVSNNGIISGNSIDIDGTISGGTIALTGSNAVLDLEQANAIAGGAVVTGFVPGDQIILGMGAGDGGTFSLNNGTLVVSSGGNQVQAIPLAGTVGLGNLLDYNVVYRGGAATLTYEPAGNTTADIVAPTSETVAAGGTLAVNGVTIEPQYPNDSLGSLSITATSGTLYLSGAQGSGTHAITLSNMTDGQASAELANLSYVPAAGQSSDVVSLVDSTPSPVTIQRDIPIAITGGSSGPSLNEPASETVSQSGTVAVPGSYSDSFAANNAGQLYLGISDGSGTLSATNASGQAVAGSGTNTISVSTDYVDLNAILANLHYTAGASAGSDTIRFDIWNQAGTETTGATSVTIDPPSFSRTMSLAPSSTSTDLVPGSYPGATSSDLGISGTSSGSIMNTASLQPIGVPLTVGQS